MGEERTEINHRMAAIRSKDTKPEAFIRKLLFSAGYRFRKNTKNHPGHPDVWMRKYNTVIFVNGCFWHRHTGCKYAYNPKNNTAFWNAKFENNIRRDEQNKHYYQNKGIKYLVIWECSINKTKTEDAKALLLAEIVDFINSDNLYLEI